MNGSAFVVVTLLAFVSPTLQEAQSLDPIQKMEASGDSAGARAALARDAQSNPGNVSALTAYAEFLERHNDAETREAYSKLLAQLRASGDTARAAAIARRLAILDLLAGDREGASRNLDIYNSGGSASGTVGSGGPASSGPASAGPAS